MPTIPNNEVGRIGIIKDIDPSELPYHAWSDGDNVRVDKSGVSKMLGWEEVYASPGVGDRPVWAFQWISGTDLYWIYATADSLFRMDASSHLDVSQSGGYSGDVSSLWTGGVFNGVPIANNNELLDDPQQWDSATTKFKDLENWPAGLKCKIIGFYDNIMIAANLSDGGTLYSNSLQWSTIADPGAVPSSWDYTSTANTAGRVPLAKTGGEILEYRQLGEYGMIYKEDAFIRMDFIGGEFIFDFTWLTIQHGILGTNCSAEFDGKHFVVTKGHFVITDGKSIQNVGEDENREYVFNTINEDYLDRTFVVPNYAMNEIWVCYVNEEVNPIATTANYAAIWNYKRDTWTFTELGTFNYIAMGIIDNSTESRIFDDQDYTYDSDDRVYDFKTFAPSQIKLLACDPDEEKFFMLDSTGKRDGNNFFARLERVGLPITGQDEEGKPMIDPETNKLVRRIYPIVTSTGKVTFFFGAQRILDGPVDWQGPFHFDPNVDRKIDIRLNGKYIAIRCETSDNIAWTLRGYLMDVEIVGDGSR